MASKMQLDAVGKMCHGYTMAENVAFSLSMQQRGPEVSCETCIHWKNQRCSIDLFDKILSSLDQA